jgi:hypothetical protein
MARFDLNGNPMADDGPPPPGGGGQVPAGAPAGQQYDLAGNPIPSQSYAPPPAPAYPPSGGPPPGGPSPYGAPPPPSPYGAPAQYTPPTYGSGPLQASRFDGDQIKKIVVSVLAGSISFVVAFWLVHSLFPPAVPAPAGYESYALPDHSYTIDKPTGWEATTDLPPGTITKQIHGGVAFQEGTARIEIVRGTPMDTSAAGVNMIAQVANSIGSSPTIESFNRYKFRVHDRVAGYHELKRYWFTPPDFPTGECAIFTASRPKWGIGGPINGYYIAMGDTYESVIITCECRKSDWTTISPVFQHIVNSLAPTQT